MYCWWFLLRVSLVIITGPIAWAGEVAGDLSAFQLVRDVQGSNLSAFPTGAMEFVATYSASSKEAGQPAVPGREIFLGRVIWKGEDDYWQFQRSFEVRNERGDWNPRELGRAVQRITNGQGTMSYSEHADSDGAIRGWCIRQLGNVGPDFDALAVLPRQAWYGPGAPFMSRTWHTLLDPEFNPKHILKRIVERPDGDRIVVTLVPNSGESRVITCSLRAGGNVVRSERGAWRAAPTGVVSAQEIDSYEWLPLADGRHRLKRLEHVSTTADGKGASSYVLEISEFEPQPVIAADRFRFESIRMLDGTNVREERNGASKEFVVGRGTESSGVTQNQLDALAEELRRAGFAAPDR